MAETKRRAVLSGRQLLAAYSRVWKSVAPNRPHNKWVDAADDELSKYLQITHNIDGSFKVGVMEDLNSLMECEFSVSACLGIKLALVQAITGNNAGKQPEGFGDVKRLLIPIAKELKLWTAIKKETNWEKEEESENADFKFDDEVEEKKENKETPQEASK